MTNDVGVWQPGGTLTDHYGLVSRLPDPGNGRCVGAGVGVWQPGETLSDHYGLVSRLPDPGNGRCVGAGVGARQPGDESILIGRCLSRLPRPYTWVRIARGRNVGVWQPGGTLTDHQGFVSRLPDPGNGRYVGWGRCRGLATGRRICSDLTRYLPVAGVGARQPGDESILIGRFLSRLPRPYTDVQFAAEP